MISTASSLLKRIPIVGPYILSPLGNISTKAILLSLLALSIIRTAVCLGFASYVLMRDTICVASSASSSIYHIFKAAIKRN